jgi:hypothetical protein
LPPPTEYRARTEISPVGGRAPRLKISSESVSFSTASGKVGGSFSKSEKTWIPSAFKLTIEGLDCSKVSKIDPFTVKQTDLVDEIGDEREIVKAPSQVVFPNLRMTLSESGAQSWLDRHEDFVIKGNNDDSQERTAGFRSWPRT